MSQTSSQFNEIIDSITPDEATWIQEYMDKLEYPICGWELERYRDTGKIDLWLYSDDCYDEDRFVTFVGRFIRKWRPSYVFGMTIAYSESKPLAGAFGGGWIVITGIGIYDGDTWEAKDKCIRDLD